MIFNSPEFHALNGVEPTTYGCLTGVWKDGVFENGYSAPFAGFDIPDDTPPWRVQEMVGDAVGQIPHNVRIKLPPPIYTPTWHAQVKTLLDLGFRVERAEINQHVEDANVLPTRNGRRALSAARSLDLSVGITADEEPVYEVIRRNRAAKDRPLRLSLDYLRDMGTRFKVEWWRMCDGDDVVAGAVCYRLSDDILLVVYWGDDPDHDLPCSPMPLLCDTLQTTAPILDLGISTDPGLMQFKRSVGAKEGLRLDMVRGL